MDFNTTKKHLQVIQDLHEKAITENGLSQIDKDILMGYIRVFYQDMSDVPVLKAEIPKAEAQQPVNTTKSTEQPATKKTKFVFLDNTVTETPKTSSNTKIENTVSSTEIKKETATTTKKVTFQQPPTKETKAEPIRKEETPVDVVKTPVREIKKDPVHIEEPPVRKTIEPTPVTLKKEEAKPPVVEPKETADFDPDFEELFAFQMATDLSQKLSESPIANLKQAFGLNEKFLYINELFGGDVSLFKDTIDALNDGEDFDEARLYLETHLVGAFEWMDKTRKNRAKDFIKLVRRRFL